LREDEEGKRGKRRRRRRTRGRQAWSAAANGELREEEQLSPGPGRNPRGAGTVAAPNAERAVLVPRSQVQCPLPGGDFWARRPRLTTMAGSWRSQRQCDLDGPIAARSDRQTGCPGANSANGGMHDLRGIAQSQAQAGVAASNHRPLIALDPYKTLGGHDQRKT
jgi:hypothetical protein